MNISKCLVSGAKFLFKKPSEMSKSKNIALALGLGYAGVCLGTETYKSITNKDLDMSNMLNSTVGLAVAGGSIFGLGGAIIAGAGMKYLVETNKKNLAQEKINY